jgi:predicted amidohydrolase YtcJ
MTYAFRSLRDAGARMAFGSDWPVAPATPLEGIHAAVTRRTLDGANPDGWIPEQKIRVEDALRGYTIDAAFASFEESEKGSITRGKLADFVMIDTDITRAAPAEIPDVNITMTVVGGRVAYER